MRGLWMVAVAGLAVAGRAEAQSEEVIRRFFEGKTVLVKVDMPGSERGVDVYPGTSQPVDFPKLAKRLKEFGVAVRRGDEILVTKLKVKKDLIEFQLGGGGFGTMGDDASSSVFIPSAGKSEREKNLEKDIGSMSDASARRKAQEELDQLRRDRARADASSKGAAAQASQLKQANLRQRRAEGGSRFNLRYDPVVPDEAVTPDGIMRALSEYVDFGPMGSAGRGETRGGRDDPPPPAGEGPAGLRKGMLVEDVDRLLGRPEGISQKSEGSLRVSVSVYASRTWRVEAEFVEGVLVRFVVSSK